ncbi:MAG: PTS sugar transporter subunit IIA [Syntrophorhabdaceae bacterium]|nr:PTS sugar transporter subunit IIA [Syntrophorhabdaceae bacterium]
MIGAVVVSHGIHASGLIQAAEIIVGKIEGMVAVDMTPSMGVEDIHSAVETAVQSVDKGKGVLVMTDMFGGTPSNIALAFLGTHPVEVITGVNLPMMVKFPYARQSMALPELVHHLQECGRLNITVPGDMLKKKPEKPDKK